MGQVVRWRRQVVRRHGKVVAAVWVDSCGGVGLVASADLFPFFLFFLSLFSFESSLHGSHSLVELMV